MESAPENRVSEVLHRVPVVLGTGQALPRCEGPGGDPLGSVHCR